MKSIKSILLCGAVMASALSCNFLDVVPDDTATLDDAFVNETTAERFLRTCYSFQLNEANYRESLNTATSNEFVSSVGWDAMWFPHMSITNGSNSAALPFPMNVAQGSGSDLWWMSFQGIRQCYIFLENVDAAVPARTSQADFDRNKAIWKGEAWFLIGYYHHLMFEKYGPIPVVEEYPRDNTKRPRLPIDQVVEKINGFYDRAMETLPEHWVANGMGRASRLVALSMKARLYAFAASPLFNGSQAPYSTLVGKEGEKLIPAYDKEKWKTAMDAAQVAITAAKSLPDAFGGPRALYTYYSTNSDPITSRTEVRVLPEELRRAYLNCRYLMVDQNPATNQETIWSYTGNMETTSGSVQAESSVKVLGQNATTSDFPRYGWSTSLAVVKLFYSINGLPVESDPDRGYIWDATGRMTVPAGANTANLFLNREPRFYAAVGYTGGVYEFNGSTEYVLDFKMDGLHGWLSNATERGRSGALIGKKFISPVGSIDGSQYRIGSYPLCQIRLAELYLLYAEACAEYNGSLDATARGYLKEIHDRAGLDGNNIYYAGYSGAALVDAVRRERMIEFVYERKWYDDLRRWLLADKWYNEGIWGSQGMGSNENGQWGMNPNATTTAEHFRETQINTTNGFSKMVYYRFLPEAHYLYPLKTTTLNVNDQLVQNPNY